MNFPLLSIIIFFCVFASCRTLEDFKASFTQPSEESDLFSLSFLQNQTLEEAFQRWPHLSRESLIRRAQILRLGVTFEELRRLDQNFHPNVEYEILARKISLLRKAQRN